MLVEAHERSLKRFFLQCFWRIFDFIFWLFSAFFLKTLHSFLCSTFFFFFFLQVNIEMGWIYLAKSLFKLYETWVMLLKDVTNRYYTTCIFLHYDCNGRKKIDSFLLVSLSNYKESRLRTIFYFFKKNVLRLSFLFLSWTMFCGCFLE
jgi:hypothetical protein